MFNVFLCTRFEAIELALRHSAAQLCKILHTNAAAAATQTYRIVHILKIVKTNRDIVERAAETSRVIDFVSLDKKIKKTEEGKNNIILALQLGL
uniref:Uncharacterized protein n=1 Tax=Trichogramma kaykai TaxID=54128 RepID=A0ABD2XKL3_9HYME